MALASINLGVLMKKVFVSLIVLFSFSLVSWAEDPVQYLLEYNFGQKKKVNEASDMQYTVTITEEGDLYLTKAPLFGGEKALYHHEMLDSATVSLIKREVYVLQDAEIIEVPRRGVCKIGVLPVQTVDHLAVQGENGVSKVVMGPSGCWVPSPIYPAKTQAKNSAITLKKILKVLAYESQK